MKNKKVMVLLALCVFSLTIVSAADLTFPINTQIDLKRPCFNNNSFCSTSAFCNLTMFYPDGELWINNNQTTNQISFYNFTLQKSDNKKFGVHQAIMVCCDPNGDIKGCGKDTFTIEVTGDGQSFNVFPYQFIILIGGILLIISGKWKEELRLFKHLGSIIVLIIGVVTLYPGYGFLNYSNLIGQVVGFSAIGFGFYFLVEDSFSRKKQAEWVQQDWEEVDDGRFHSND